MFGSIKIGIVTSDNCPACTTQKQALQKAEVPFMEFKNHTKQGQYFCAVLHVGGAPTVFIYRQHKDKSPTFSGALMHRPLHSWRAGIVPVEKIVKKLGELK